jgi:hypothetical protein
VTDAAEATGSAGAGLGLALALSELLDAGVLDADAPEVEVLDAGAFEVDTLFEAAASGAEGSGMTASENPAVELPLPLDLADPA